MTPCGRPRWEGSQLSETAWPPRVISIGDPRSHHHLEVPIIASFTRRQAQATESRNCQRGVPQRGVISPLLANLYFRRCLLAWKKLGHDHATQSVMFERKRAAEVTSERPYSRPHSRR